MASWHSQPAFNGQAYGQQTEYSGQHEANVVPNPSQHSYSQEVAAHHGQPQQLSSSYLPPQQTQQTSYAQQPSQYQPPASYSSPQQLQMSSGGYQLPVSNYTSTGPNYQTTSAGVLATPKGYSGAYTPQPGQTLSSTVDATGRGQVAGSSAWTNRVASAPAVTPVSGMIGGQAPQPRPPVLTGGPGHAENLAGRMASGWAQPEADSASGWLHGGSSNLKDAPTSFGTQKPGEFSRGGGIFKPQASVATPGLWQPPPQLLDQRLPPQAGILDARREERELDLQREEMGWQQSWSEYNGHPQGAVGNPHDPRPRLEDRHALGMSNNAAGVLGGGMRSSAQQLDPMGDPMRGGQYHNHGGDGILFDNRRGPMPMEHVRDMMGPRPMFEQPYQEPHGGMDYHHHGHPMDIHPQQPHGFGPRGPGLGAGPARRPRGPWAKQPQQEAVQSRPLGQKRSWQQSNPPPRFQRPLQEPRAKRAAGNNATQATNASGSPGWCDFCKLDCGTLDALQSHVNGKKHKRKLKLVEEEKEKAEAGTAPAVVVEEKEQVVAESGEKEGDEAETGEGPVQKYQCRVCLVECSGLGNLREHRLGKKHKKELDRLRERGEYVDDSVPPELLEAMDALAKAADPSAVPLSGPVSHAAVSQALAKTYYADAALASGMAVEVGGEWKCIPCDVPCNSRNMLESHLNGKKHKIKIEGPSADGKKKGKGEGTEDGEGGTKKVGRKGKRGQNKAEPGNAEADGGAAGEDVKTEGGGLDIDVKDAVDTGTEGGDVKSEAVGLDADVKEAADAGIEGGGVKSEATGLDVDVKEAADADVGGIASEAETGFDLNATSGAADTVVVVIEETIPDATVATVEVVASVSEVPEGVDNTQADTGAAAANASDDVTPTTAEP